MRRGARESGRVGRGACLVLALLACAPGLSALRAQEASAREGAAEEVKAHRLREAIAQAARIHESFDSDQGFVAEWDERTQRVLLVYWGNARGSYLAIEKSVDGTPKRSERVQVWADRILVYGTRGGESEEDGELEDDGGSGGDDRARGSSGVQSPSFYAEGNVRVEKPELVIRADAFFFNRDSGNGIAIHVRGRGTPDAAKNANAAIKSLQTSFLDSEEDEPEPPATRTLSAADLPLMEPLAGGAVARSDPPGVERRRPRQSGRRQAGQLAFRAERLVVLGLDRYEGESIEVSSCEFGVPHYAIRSSRLGVRVVRVTAEEGDVEGEEEGDASNDGEAGRSGESEGAVERPRGPGRESDPPSDGARADEPEDEPERTPIFEFDPDASWVRIAGTPVLPIPLPRWRTDFGGSPIRRPLYSNSSKFGHRPGLDWNLNFFLGAVPGTDAEPVREVLDDSRLDLRTEYLEERGFGIGAFGEAGRRPRRWVPWELDSSHWDYYTEGHYYSIDDHGADRTAPATDPDIDDRRWWGRVLHRHRLPHVGVLDVEYSQYSDDNFLNEYFQETRREKEQENIVLLRRSFTDNVAASALVKYRTNDFETTTERLPELDLFVLEQPLFDTGIYSSLAVEGVYLRNRPSDEIDVPRSIDDPTDALEARTRSYGRFDARNEWSVPFGFGQYVRLRPFANARLSAYETGLHPDDHSITRHLFGAGITASQQWSRVFPLRRAGWADRWFDITALRHVVIPKVTYASLFENNVDPGRLFQVDEVDTADDLEVVDLSLRNVIWARGRGPRLKPQSWESDGRNKKRPLTEGVRDPRLLKTVQMTTHKLLDVETSMRWFLQPARDNGDDRYSEFDLDALVYPLKYVALRSRNFMDPNNDFRFLMSDNSVTVDVVPETLFFTVGERIRQDRGEFYYGRIGIRASRRYSIDAYYGFDPRESKRTDVEIRVTRFFHRFALELGYAFDAGERGNQTFSVNFSPVELLDEGWERRARRFFRYD